MMIRSLFRVLSATLLGVTLSIPLTSLATADSFPDRIELPAGFQPEGITIGPGGIAYFGSRANGNIYAANLRTGDGSVISEGPGTPSVGLKVDNHGHLFVAGGPSGTGRVVDLDTGDFTTYPFTSAPTFVNDVVLTRTFAWFTDSQRPQLYGIPLGAAGEPG